MAIRHRPRVPERARRLLAERLRLAQARSEAERVPAVHGRASECRPALHTCPGSGAATPAALAVAWLAGLRLGIPQGDRTAHRSGPLRLRRGGCVSRGRTVAARVWAVLQARPAALRRACHS